MHGVCRFSSLLELITRTDAAEKVEKTIIKQPAVYGKSSPNDCEAQYFREIGCGCRSEILKSFIKFLKSSKQHNPIFIRNRHRWNSGTQNLTNMHFWREISKLELEQSRVSQIKLFTWIPNKTEPLQSLTKLFFALQIIPTSSDAHTLSSQTELKT